MSASFAQYASLFAWGREVPGSIPGRQTTVMRQSLITSVIDGEINKNLHSSSGSQVIIFILKSLHNTSIHSTVTPVT